MTARARRITAAVLLAGCLVGCTGSSRPQHVTQTVTMEAVAFQPAHVNVKVGDTIEWVNKDPFPHTVTSPAGDLGSPDVMAEGRWSWTAAKRGDIAYACRYHPTMTGSIHVE